MGGRQGQAGSGVCCSWGTLTHTPVVEGFIDRGSDAGWILASKPPKTWPKSSQWSNSSRDLIPACLGRRAPQCGQFFLTES